MLSQANTKFFDLPYLMNRIKLIAGDKVANRMSPLNLVNREEINVRVDHKLFIIYMVLPC